MKIFRKTQQSILFGLGALSLGLLSMLGTAAPAWAEEAATLNSGDTAWMIVATALVLFMTLPGLALFYGGLVRTKNVLSVLGQCLAMASVMTLLWIIYGYSYAATDGNAIMGDASKLFLKDLTVDALSGTIPESVFLTFQMTFAIITPALIVGAFAERMKFSAMLIFMIIWFTFSYIPVWHMAWGGGLFAGWGVLDFAGGTVVHINAGIAALVVCIMIGSRTGYPTEPMRPHSLVLTVVGASMLWVGWFGFNAGSEFAADGIAGMAMLVTQISTATAVVVWMLIEWFGHGKPSILGMATAAVAGLVAITPASGTAGPMGAILIGAASAVFCYLAATKLKRALGYDDSLDVFSVHGIGGIVGALLTGLCAAEFMGGVGLGEAVTVTAQVTAQAKGIGVTVIWSGVVSVVAYLVANALTGGARISEEGEQQGLDLTDHDESGYIA